MLFVVYQQIELDTFLPIALEFKRLKKRKDIRFLFVDQKNYAFVPPLNGAISAASWTDAAKCDPWEFLRQNLLHMCHNI